ncbi:MAG: RNA 2',3'-cyclic phosphodiesterase [Actinobacteria bacterium]|nr:RNA 2',3'-cyclic phosphodiesterase [Actinomycetota bacterium]MCB8996037.1 RNA 2',3'-cyclic phosphodiesterase [Actinomycetota bacterium]MCB9424434.1 RNA 2',3'-cyclic phosphodiesterase [Actinomycetota bacterium]HRY08414.1 RNA 2',3'-cyclic phosphodiesterase [Candidatus Nanopelagicales bacterium]
MTARLFVALWPPDDVVARAEKALAAVRHTDNELRWQSPDRWHITVGFLGDRDVGKEVDRFALVPLTPAEPVRLQGAGHFGPVLWLGVATSHWLSDQAAAVMATMRAERRRFRGHMTVARSRTRTGDRQVRAAVSALEGFQSPSWTPSELTLVLSTIGPRPAYEVIARSPLTAVGP